MTEEQGQGHAEVPMSFRLSTYWKRGRGEEGPTSMDTRRISLEEALGHLLQQLTDDEFTVERRGTVTTIVIDWSKVPPEIRNPFAFGVGR